MTDDDVDVTVERVLVARSGHIGDYDVFIRNDEVRIVEDVADDPRMISRTVDGLGDFVQEAETFRLGWAELPDGDEVVYCYDRADDCFGYAVNLTSSLMSEWGYAPFES